MKEQQEEKGIKKNLCPYQVRVRAALKTLTRKILTLADKIMGSPDARAVGKFYGINWGASFITVFIALLLVSVGLFDLKATVLAAQIAEYATAFLILGIVFQMMGYLYYRNYVARIPTTSTISVMRNGGELRWSRGESCASIFGGEPTSRSGNELGVRYRIEFFSEFFRRIDKTKFAIDLGMGYGGYLKAIADVVPQLVGVEADPSYLVKSEMKGVSICSTVESLPIKDRSCSVALLFEVLEHVQDEDKALDSIREALVDHGFLFLTVPNRFHLFETHGFQFEGKTIQNLAGIGIPFLSLAPNVIRRNLERARIYSQKDIVTKLSSRGLVTLRIGYMPFIFGATSKFAFVRSARAVLNKICENTPFKQMTPTCMIVAVSRMQKGTANSL